MHSIHESFAGDRMALAVSQCQLSPRSIPSADVFLGSRRRGGWPRITRLRTRRSTDFALGLLIILICVWTVAVGVGPAFGQSNSSLMGSIVAVGITGAGAVSPVGVFHSGGPIHDKPEFAAFTEPGRVLDPARILVASSSNFGAPLAQPDRPSGSILSLDPRGPEPIVIPPTFATPGDQATALEGRLQLYTAQSPAFLNGYYNKGAVTANIPTVSNPRGISLNNGFGRPWFSNAPMGVSGAGTESVVDPDGRPLAGAPSQVAGGVFTGRETNRPEQLIPGDMDTATLGTALMGASPDGSGRAVFAALGSDGSVVQIHVEKGVDGLLAAGAVTPLMEAQPDPAMAASAGTRAGILFNWVPERLLYVSDPIANRIVSLTLVDDGAIFRVESVRIIQVPELSQPIDLSPSVPEIANPKFASNTTLSAGSDLYVLNRGDGTIVRLRQDGTVVGVRSVEAPGVGILGANRLNGIAVAPDAQHIWVTVSGTLPGFPDAEGVLLEVPSFGAPGDTSS